MHTTHTVVGFRGRAESPRHSTHLEFSRVDLNSHDRIGVATQDYQWVRHDQRIPQTKNCIGSTRQDHFSIVRVVKVGACPTDGGRTDGTTRDSHREIRHRQRSFHSSCHADERFDRWSVSAETSRTRTCIPRITQWPKLVCVRSGNKVVCADCAQNCVERTYRCVMNKVCGD
jgi:hypothetical protein